MGEETTPAENQVATEKAQTDTQTVQQYQTEASTTQPSADTAPETQPSADTAPETQSSADELAADGDAVVEGLEENHENPVPTDEGQ